MYPVKYYRAYMKKYGVKGTSRFNKQQLITKMLDVSNKNYQTRKTIKQDTTISLVLQLTKNENITNHIMSYVVNTTHYDYIKNTVHSNILYELQLFELASYGIHPNMDIDVPLYYSRREEMLNIHTHLTIHHKTNKIIITHSLYHSIDDCKRFLLFRYNSFYYISKTNIMKLIKLRNEEHSKYHLTEYSYN